MNAVFGQLYSSAYDLLYQGTSQQFIADATQARLANQIAERFFHEFRYKPGPSEVRSWQNSLGAMANVYARYAQRPGAVIREPGILLLVPGSVGFRSVSFLMERDTTLSLDTGLLLVTLLVSLVAGLMFGDLLISPRRSL